MKNRFPIFNSLRHQRSTPQNRVVNFKGGSITAEWNEKNEPARVAILDTIGKDPWSEGGFTEKDFRNALADIPRTKELDILINSKGGDVFEGFGIKNAIAQWPNRVTATITGVAASTASWMILDADEIRAPRASQMFIHEAMTVGMGNAEDMRDIANRLDTTSDQIAGFYAAKSGKSVSEMRELMKKNTLMTGNQAKELGLVDTLTDESPVRNFAPEEITGMGRFIANFNNSAPSQGAANKPNHQPQETPVNRAQKIALLNSWGVKFDNTISDAELDALIAAGKPAAENKLRTANIAILNAWGVKFKETDTDEAITNLVLAGKPATPAAKPIATNDDVIELRNELKAIKTQRITEQFNTLAATRPHLAENRESLLAKALLDETMLNVYSAFPESASPINHGGRIQVIGNPTIEAFNKLKPGPARRAWLLDGENQVQLLNQWRRFDPKNANTQDAALVTAHLADGIITIAPTKLAILSMFVRNVNLNPIKKGKVQVQYFTAGATGSQNPESFQSGNSTVDNVEVTVNHENLSFHVSNDDRHNGLQLAALADGNADAFSYQLSDVVTGKMLVGSYGAGLVIGTAANFDSDDTSPILAVAKNYRQKNLLLDGGHLAYLTPKTTEQLNWATNGAFGFNKIAEHNRYTGATANTVGFVSGPDALAIAAGKIGEVPARYYESIVDVNVLGFPVQIHTWFDTDTRELWASYGLMFGAAPADVTQAELLLTA